MKKNLKLDRLKIKSFIIGKGESEKMKGGTDLSLSAIDCTTVIPLTIDGCVMHTQFDGCTSNPCTDPNKVSIRCLHTLDCVSEYPNVCHL